MENKKSISKKKGFSTGEGLGIIATIIFVFAFGIILIIYQTHQPLNLNQYSSSPSLPTTNAPASQTSAPATTSTCTKIEYSDWSPCSEKGAQIRSIINAYPQGCNLSNDVKQQESCIYVPIKLDAETLIQKIFQQISQAPDKTIETEYVSGQDGNVTATVRYAIANDNNLVIWTESKDRQSGKVISNIYLRDSNQDLHPDIFSNDGAEWYPINIQSQTDQAQILAVWAIQITYFAENLLKN